MGGAAALKAIGIAAKVLQATGHGTSAEGRELIARARIIVQQKIGQNITAATATPFAEADHLLLTGDLTGAVTKLTAAYRAA
ncbi:hypothetical protein [Streptomyces sp.]|uniref:hypothetical protein n=1 Tax=Streptomyces sp. TaxID=1931 RepID=UPI002F93AA43